jgi:hypothetical protein
MTQLCESVPQLQCLFPTSDDVLELPKWLLEFGFEEPWFLEEKK